MSAAQFTMWLSVSDRDLAPVSQHLNWERQTELGLCWEAVYDMVGTLRWTLWECYRKVRQLSNDLVIPSPQIGFPPSLSGSAEQLFTVTFAGTKPLMMFVWSLGLRGSVASGEVSRSAVVSTIHWKLVRANSFIFIRTGTYCLNL